MGFFRRLRGESPPPASGPKREVASVYVGLRDTILSLDPTSVGIHQTAATPNVWGVVMDWSLDDAVATIVSLADGTTSMYLSTGGGSLGAGEHPAAAAASLSAVRLAETMLDDFPGATGSPLPPRGRTALTLLTFSGLRRFEDDNAAFENDASRVSPVANAMQNVIHEIQVAEASVHGGRSEAPT
jgi:hypothetical protein